MDGSAGRVGLMDVNAIAESARTWVEQTCAAQGVPVKVTNAGAVEGVAVLLGQTRQTGSNRAGSKRFRPRTAGATTTRSRTEATIAR
jgi:hypothetical protein